MTKLPPFDSPQAEAYLHASTSQSMREVLASKALSVGDLAGLTSLPIGKLRDALNGKCPLPISVWKAIAAALQASQSEFSFSTSQRNGTPCWELYWVLI